MAEINWIEHDDGWQAGPYRIELLAPRHWVLTRQPDKGKRGADIPSITATAGSLRALKAEVSVLERREERRRRLVSWLALAAGSVLAILIVYLSQVSFAPLVIVTASSLTVLALVNSIDCLARRSWENLSDVYQ